MPTTPYSYRILQGGAAGLSVPVPFPFISRSHVQVFANLSLADGTFDRLYISGTDYNWINNGQISMVVSTAGKTLTVIRGTPIDEPLVNWTDGSNVDATDLQIADKQKLYAIQENLDGVRVVVSISLSTSQQLAGQSSAINTQVSTQNAALLAQVNAANAATLAQVNASNAATIAQLAGVNTSLADARLLALGASDVGMIAYTTSLVDPLGWGPAIGATVSRVAFAELFLKFGTFYGAGDGSTTFVAGPDLRGVVLRGLDNGRGFDLGRAKGSLQQDQNKEIVIPFRRATPAFGTGDIASNLEGAGSIATYGAGQEARMKNVAERAIMKYYSQAIQVNLGATTTPPKLVGKDPAYGNVVLHLPLTSDTGFTDVSGRSLSVTPQGNAAISTSLGKWGSSSAYFDGSSNTWLKAVLADVIGMSDYTIRFWFRPLNVSRNQGLYAFHDDIDASNRFTPLNNRAEGGLFFQSPRAIGNDDFNYTLPTVSAASWAFFQQTRANGYTETRVNGSGGVTVGNPTYPQGFPFAVNISQTQLAIGAYYGMDYLLLGHMNDFQVSLVALPHSVPTGPLPRG